MSDMSDWTIDGQPLRGQWSFPEGVTYLNHGSFGPSPRCVREAREAWTARLEQQPMDFFVRKLEGELEAARQRLAAFVGAAASDLVFVENATYGMNVVAASVRLRAGDEVLATDHEYGAVLRIWRRLCKRAGADLVVRKLKRPFESPEETAADFLEGVTDRTRLIIVSHVTSPTALILPVREICRGARKLGIPVCIDGPHAVAMLDVKLRDIDCDYYCASGHKWLSAPFGTGFLYVARRRQQTLETPIMSWGGSLSGRPPDWKDEFNWPGTRDPAGYLAIGAAIDFLEAVGIDRFRRSTHQLAEYARRQIAALTGLDDIPAPESSDWYGSMIALPIPTGENEPPRAGHRDPLQDVLWERHGIEAPIIHWQGERFIRVSCHLYNSRQDIDRLTAALRDELC